MLLTALERRWNFAIGDRSAKAHAFDEFVQCIDEMRWTEKERCYKFTTFRLDINLIPQWLQYDRTQDLELWVLKLEEDT